MFADKTKRTKRIGSGYKSMYKTPEFKEAQATFEKRLGIYAFKHPRSYNAVNKGLTKMKKVLVTYYKEKITDIEDEREKERKILRQAFTTSRHPDSSGQVGSNISDHDLDLIIGNTIYHPGQGAVTKDELDKLKKDKDAIVVASNAGNLREKITAFYNAAYYSYGKNCIADKSDGTGGANFTFKNILEKEVIGKKTKKLRSYDASELPKDAKKEQLEENKEIGHARQGSIIDKLGLNFKAVMDIRRKTSQNIRRAGFLSAWFNRTHKRDVLDCISLALNAPTFKEKLRYIKNYFFKLEWYMNNPDKKRTKKKQRNLIRKINYQHEMGLDLSEREKEFQTDYMQKHLPNTLQEELANGTKTQKHVDKRMQNIKEAFNADKTDINTIIRNGKYYKFVSGWYGKRLEKKGFSLINGTSGTTSRMLTIYRALGFNNKKDCLDFRLALMGWMLPEEDHSLYEILKGSHVVNVFGDEDLTDAASMDESVSPLSRQELLDHVCEKQSFERNKIHTDFGEVKLAQPMFPKDLVFFNLFNMQDPKDGALNDTHNLSLLNYSNLRAGINRKIDGSADNMYFPYMVALMSYTSENYLPLNEKLQIKHYAKSNKLTNFIFKHFCLTKTVTNVGSIGFSQLKKLNKKGIKHLIDALDVNNNMITEALAKTEKYAPSKLISEDSKELCPLYSGQILLPFQFRAYKKGAIIKTTLSLSFSKEKSVAEDFLLKKSKKSSRGVPVIFVLNPNACFNGVDLEQISICHGESEVLYSINRKLKVTEVTTKPIHDYDELKTAKLEQAVRYVYLDDIDAPSQSINNQGYGQHSNSIIELLKQIQSLKQDFSDFQNYGQSPYYLKNIFWHSEEMLSILKDKLKYPTDNDDILRNKLMTDFHDSLNSTKEKKDEAIELVILAKNKLSTLNKLNNYIKEKYPTINKTLTEEDVANKPSSNSLDSFYDASATINWGGFVDDYY